MNLFDVHSATTKHGMRLRVIPMAGTSTATMMVYVGTGSRHEHVKEGGISHFLEHLFFKGSEKRPTTRAISEALDGIGGDFNAFTSKETTAFYAKAGAQHAELITDVIADMLIRPLFDPKELHRERGVIIEEMNMYEDMPQTMIGEYWETLLYGTHPLGRETIGTKEIVSTVPRAAFLKYIGRQYGVQNTVVCLAGNVDVAAGTKLLQTAFGKFPKGKPTPPTPFANAWGTKRVFLKQRTTDQAHVIVGGPGVSYTNKRRAAFDVLASLLGGSMSSRMFIEVRERRGLAYSVRTSAEHFTDTGHLSTQAGVDPSKLAGAVQVMLAEYRKVREKRVSAAELQKVKNYMKGKMLLRLESSDAVASHVGGQEVLTNRMLPLEDIFHQIDAVTTADVQAVAKQALAPSVLRVAVVASNATEDVLLHLLKTHA